MKTGLNIAALGGLEIILDDTAVSNLASRKAEALLVYLACNPMPHARDTLAALLWDDRPQNRALGNLSVLLSSLRKKLDSFLTITRYEIGFNFETEHWLDVAQFENQIKNIVRKKELSRAEAAQLARSATLYRGDFLAGFYIRQAGGFDEWMFLERERLQQLALQAYGRLADFYMERGQYPDGIASATCLVQLNPLLEMGHRRLMMLYVLDGQRSAALAQYMVCRHLLDSELGVDPDPETTTLYEQIKAGAVKKAKPARTAITPASAPQDRLPPRSLPTPATPLIGRENEVALITQRLDDPACRLLTLVGPGGIGKTRLALHIAHQKANDFLHGAVFVPLAALESAEYMVETLADALHFSLSRMGNPSTQLLDFLREKEMLLILDNMEHLRDSANLLSLMLKNAVNMRILATSQERLHLREEWLVPISGLPCSENGKSIEAYPAGDLFVQSVRKIQPEFTPSADEAVAISRICRFLEGAPLGIELAASWVRVLSCQEVAVEIENSLHFLESVSLNLPVRHRSLQAVFAHSWSLLNMRERTVMQRLSIFRSGFSREAAEQVAHANLVNLMSLVDKSFLRPTEALVAGARRFEIHQMLHQFAVEKMNENPAMQSETRRLHCRFFADFLQSWERPLQGGQQIEALAAIQVEIKNIRTALAWVWENQDDAESLQQSGLNALNTLFYFYNMRSWFQEGFAVFSHAVDWAAQQAAGDPILLGWLLARKGWLAYLLGSQTEGREMLERGLALLRRRGARDETIFCLNYLGAIAYYQNEFEQAYALLEQSLQISRAANDQFGEAIGLNILGMVMLAQGDLAQAEAALQASLALKDTLGDRWGMAFSLGNLGQTASAQGKIEEARRLYTASLEIRREIEDKRGQALCLRDLARLEKSSGNQVTAARLYAECAQLFAEIGSHTAAAAARANQAGYTE